MKRAGMDITPEQLKEKFDKIKADTLVNEQEVQQSVFAAFEQQVPYFSDIYGIYYVFSIVVCAVCMHADDCNGLEWSYVCCVYA